MNIPPLVLAMVGAAFKSVDDLRAKITNVKFARFQDNCEIIQFELNGQTFEGPLRGRNKALCLGFGADKDKAIALRVLLDGDANKID